MALLRGNDAELGTARPQPRLADIDALAREAEAAGQQVDLVVDLEGAEVRESVQRTIYRVVQESLTNARKHAPHAQVRVQVTDGDGAIRVIVDNQVPVGVTDADLLSGGSGLIGLHERVRLEGGTLESGIESGRFRVLVGLAGRSTVTSRPVAILLVDDDPLVRRRAADDVRWQPGHLRRR